MNHIQQPPPQQSNLNEIKNNHSFSRIKSSLNPNHHEPMKNNNNRNNNMAMMWNANICLGMVDSFLNWLQTFALTVDDVTTSYTIEYMPPNSIQNSSHFPYISIKNNGPNTGFLPEWWI